MTIEESLKINGVHLATPIGDSMKPTLKGLRDNVVIKPVLEPLKVNDVVLCKRLDGQYVLHRIIKIKKGKYYLRGDNQRVCDKSYTKESVVGKLVGFYRKEKYVNVDSFFHKVYVVFWRIIFPLRAIFIIFRDLFKRNKKWNLAY